MRQYLDAVKNVLEKGTRKENRTGVDTISTFGEYYEIDLRDGFPLLTTKKISWKNIVVENLWFLSGDPNISLLHKHGCRFWDPWADKNGNVPSAYGFFWRHFPVQGFGLGNTHRHLSSYVYADFNDQMKWVIEELKKNPMSRRMVVSAWYPGNAQQSRLPPCHAMFIFNVQNMACRCKCHTEEGMSHNWKCCDPETKTNPHLCLHLTQRSCDMALGVPYNIAGYSFILSLVAHMVGMEPGIFAHTLVDAHVYTSKADGTLAEYDHIPGLKEQLEREPRKLPTLRISQSVRSLEDLEKLKALDTDQLLSHFELVGYDPHPDIKFKVAV